MLANIWTNSVCSKCHEFCPIEGLIELAWGGARRGAYGEVQASPRPPAPPAGCGGGRRRWAGWMPGTCSTAAMGTRLGPASRSHRPRWACTCRRKCIERLQCKHSWGHVLMPYVHNEFDISAASNLTIFNMTKYHFSVFASDSRNITNKMYTKHNYPQISVKYGWRHHQRVR